MSLHVLSTTRFEDDWAMGKLIHSFINGRHKAENVKVKVGVKQKWTANTITFTNK